MLLGPFPWERWVRGKNLRAEHLSRYGEAKGFLEKEAWIWRDSYMGLRGEGKRRILSRISKKCCILSSRFKWVSIKGGFLGGSNHTLNFWSRE
jgi:hypothetical protein